MSVATPKSQAKEPIQLDNVIVCRKLAALYEPNSMSSAIEAAKAKVTRLKETGFKLSANDIKVVHYGQLLTTLTINDYTEQLLDFESRFERSVKIPNSMHDSIKSAFRDYVPSSDQSFS